MIHIFGKPYCPWITKDTFIETDFCFKSEMEYNLLNQKRITSLELPKSFKKNRLSLREWILVFFCQFNQIWLSHLNFPKSASTYNCIYTLHYWLILEWDEASFSYLSCGWGSKSTGSTNCQFWTTNHELRILLL